MKIGQISVLLFLLRAVTAEVTSVCYFGPDSAGNYLKKTVSESAAAKCNPCICDEPKVKCLLGPNDEGNLAVMKVLKDVAENCDR